MGTAIQYSECRMLFQMWENKFKAYMPYACKSYTESWVSHNIICCNFSMLMSGNQVWNPSEIRFHNIYVTSIVVMCNKLGAKVKKDAIILMASVIQPYFVKLCVAHCQVKGLVVNYIHHTKFVTQ